MMLTPEQELEFQATRKRLIETYGERIYKAGVALGAIGTGAAALRAPDTSPVEREEASKRLSLDVAQLVAALAPGEAKAIVQVAAQIDSTVDLWMSDLRESRRL